MTTASALAAIAAWMLTYLVHSTIFIGAAMLLARRLRERPEHMSGVWKAALVGGVLTATLQVGFGLAPVGGHVVLADAPQVEPAASIVEPSVEPALASPGVPESSAPPVEVDAVAPILAASLDAPMLASAEVRTPAPIDPGAASIPASHPERASAPPWWSVALAIVGVLGATLGLLSVALAVRGLRRRLADRTPLTDGPIAAAFRELLVRTGLRRRVALSVSRSTTVPLAMGIARPEIVLPQRATVGLQTGQQHTMLAHELAHVFRHDPAWRMAALLAERVFFFQPLNRIATARIGECAEYLCDDWAARHTDERLALAQCLTEVASWVGASPVVLASAMAGSSSQLRHRVLRLLAPARPAPGRKVVGVVAALAIAAVAWLAPGVSSGNSAGAITSLPRVAALAALPELAHEHDEASVRVWTSEDGRKVVIIGADEHEPAAGGDEAAPPADPKAARRAKRRAVKANRDADRALDKAMRKAKKEGRAAPSTEEVERILSQARKEAGQRDAGDRVALRFEISEGGAHIEIEDGTRGRVVDVDELVAEAHRRHAHAHGQAARARALGEKEARKAMKEAMKARKKARHDMEHARRRLQQQLRSEDLPPEARRAIENALRQFERAMREAPPQLPAPASPPMVHVVPRAPMAPRSARAVAPPAPPTPLPPSFSVEAPPAPAAPLSGADAPPAPPMPPGMRVAPSAPQPPRARSPRRSAPRAPQDIQPIVWTN